MTDMSEQQFIRNTAPTLAGIKTGSLFPFRYETKEQAIRELRDFNHRLTPKGLRLVPLRMAEGFAMLYLYRPEQLGRDLQREDVSRLLREVGYTTTDECCCLCELRRRLNGEAEYPHEIGLFLSYPTEDVRGFMEHRDQGCKCVGCWKVYGNEDAAKRRFAQYKSCTQSYLRQYAKGKPLERLAVAM